MFRFVDTVYIYQYMVKYVKGTSFENIFLNIVKLF